MRVGLIVAAACVLLLGACQPAQPGPDDVVRGIYTAATPKLAHGQLTSEADLPLTQDFTAALNHAGEVAQQRDEPFIDGDMAANCQDCRLLTELQVPVTSPPANGAAVVEARFKLDGTASSVIWDMRQTPQGWRVDNIRGPGDYDLRKQAAQEIAQENLTCTQDRGAEEANRLVAECTQVSPATHPPCNADNACHLIEGEIARGCGMLSGQKPDFCTNEANAAAQAP